MSRIDTIADILQRSLQMVNAHLEPFTDAEMLVRPCAGANHAAWQVGQFTSAEPHMLSAYAGNIYSLPAGFAEKFTSKTAASDDASQFPSKKELLAQFKGVREATIKWVKTLSDKELDQPTPAELQRFAKTLGDLLIMQAMHNMMHIGQIQVIRRKLNKPVMF